MPYPRNLEHYSNLITVQNFPRDFAPLISEHYATLKELECYYSYEDALNMLEILAVKISNDYTIQKQQQDKISRMR